MESMMQMMVIHSRFLIDGRVRTLPILFRGSEMDGEFHEFISIKSGWSQPTLARMARAVHELFELSERSGFEAPPGGPIDWYARVKHLRGRSLRGREFQRALAAASMFVGFVRPVRTTKTRGRPSRFHIAGGGQQAAFKTGVIDARPRVSTIVAGDLP